MDICSFNTNFTSDTGDSIRKSEVLNNDMVCGGDEHMLDVEALTPVSPYPREAPRGTGARQ